MAIRSLLVPSALLALLTVAPSSSPAQPVRAKAPPPPETYEIEVRYRIIALRDERGRLFKAMMARLKELGFERDPEDEARGEDNFELENIRETKLKGTIPSSKARDVLDIAPVLTIQLMPKTDPPPAKDKVVRVVLEPAGNLGAGQTSLGLDLREVLKAVGFSEAVGYDTHGGRRLVGGLPFGQVPLLLADLRRDPAAWPQLPATLLSDVYERRGGPELLRDVLVNEFGELPEGREVVLGLVNDWGLTKPALEYMAKLPQAVRREMKREVPGKWLTLEQELLLEHALDQLSKPGTEPYDLAVAAMKPLLQSIFKSKANRQLMDRLLTKLETTGPGGALPPFFRGPTLLRAIEVRTDLPEPSRYPPETVVPRADVKLSLDLRERLKDDAKAKEKTRLEVILTATPEDRTRRWLANLREVAPSLTLEGNAGPIVTLVCDLSDARKLAELPIVSVVRLPKQAVSAVLTLPDEAGDPAKLLRLTGIDRPHARNVRGQNVQVAVLDSDFRGWDALVGKRLPATTRYVDLTLERKTDLLPEPQPAGAPGSLGSGVQVALAALLAAPDCKLTLIRVDSAAPYMVSMVQRRLAGEDAFTDNYRQRDEEVYEKTRRLRIRGQELAIEREIVMKFFLERDVRPDDDEILKRRFERKKKYEEDQKKLDEDQKAHDLFIARWLRHKTDLAFLKGLQVVVCNLNWEDGYAVDGGGHLSRFLDDNRLDALWVQPSGNAPARTWSAPVRDANGNRVVEFQDLKTPLPAGSWTHETAFLGWRPEKGDAARDLPAGTKLRFTLQWRESHDPEFARLGEDHYREPLTPLRLVLVRQFDPDGVKRPADDLEVVAFTERVPLRLEVRGNSAVYEHTLEVTVKDAGRYALRLEGLRPTSTRPTTATTLASQRAVQDVQPRLRIETVGVPGQVVLAHDATSSGAPGTPADAQRVLIVEAADEVGKVRPYATTGTPAGAELSRRAVARSQDRIGLEGLKSTGGSGLSAGYIAGQAALMLSRGDTRENVIRYLGRIPMGE